MNLTYKKLAEFLITKQFTSSFNLSNRENMQFDWRMLRKLNSWDIEVKIIKKNSIARNFKTFLFLQKFHLQLLFKWMSSILCMKDSLEIVHCGQNEFSSYLFVWIAILRSILDISMFYVFTTFEWFRVVQLI